VEAEAATPRFGPWRREVRAFLELLALCGVAVAQPALDVLSKNSSVFVAARASKLETIALAFAIVLVPPALLWGIEVLVGLAVPRARRAVHALLAAGVLVVLAAEVLKHQTGLAPLRIVILAVPIGLVGGLLVFRFEALRLFLRYLAFAPVIFVALFLASSPVTTVVFADSPPAVADVEVKQPKRIVMIVMDELPVHSLLDGRGNVDADLFPNFASLAQSSTWFRNSTTVAPYTEAAVPALLTGEDPVDEDAPPIAAEHPRNLFTLLGDEYRLNVHEAVTHLCPSSLCKETSDPGGFGTLVDNTYSLWEEFAAPRRTRPSLDVLHDSVSNGREFVQSLKPTRGPELDFLHLMLPHEPWHLREALQDDEQPRNVEQGLDDKLRWTGPWAAATAQQRHLLQTQAADTLLGEILTKLRKIGAFDDSLIVVTADHGVAFVPGHAVRGVATENYPEILWTPMFVHTPGQSAARVDDRPVRSTDVLPTVADAVGVDMPWKVDGRSMFGAVRTDPDPHVFHWIFSELVAPPGEQYSTLPGPAGFRAALAGNASTGTGPASEQLYELGQYGGLIGRPAAPLVQGDAPGLRATIDDPERFRDVDPGSSSIPWARVEGRVGPGAQSLSLAVSVDGVIAGLSGSDPGPSGSRFRATLLPEAFERGRARIEIYAVSGPPTAPELRLIRSR
jgi:hypothetical protein